MASIPDKHPLRASPKDVPSKKTPAQGNIIFQTKDDLPTTRKTCYVVAMMRCTLFICGMLVLTACAHAPNEKPLTPAEKTRMIEAANARGELRDVPTGGAQRAGCSTSTRASRFNARGNGFSGADGFDSRGCGVGGN
jgi:hypothetical protein